MGMFMILLVVIVLGGCQLGDSNKNQKPSEMDTEDLPDVRAFDDEFTRDFLQSTKEVREGYYPFLSGTEKYQTDFPASGVLGEKSYYKRDDTYEELAIHIKEPNSSIIRINYFQDDSLDLLKDNLDAFKTRIGYEGDFEEIEKNNRTIYYANYERSGYRTFVGYVLSQKNMGAVEITYKIDYRDVEKDMKNKHKESDQERALKWIESVEFSDGEEGENHE